MLEAAVGVEPTIEILQTDSAEFISVHVTCHLCRLTAVRKDILATVAYISTYPCGVVG